jgi:hypothetical protein
MNTIAALALAAILASGPSDEINLTATSINVAEPGTPVKVRILRWSTEDERRPIVTALAAPPAQPSEVAQNAARAGGARGRGAAGRGRGRGGPALAPLTPIAAFTAALGRAPTVGYLWTSDVTGYSIKYAWHAPLPNGGGDRIVLVSDRRLGAYTGAWKTASDAPATDYVFTLFELHVGPNGFLEGKTSLAAKIAVDADAKTVALENYAAAPASLAAKSAAEKPSRPSR